MSVISVSLLVSDQIVLLHEAVGVLQSKGQGHGAGDLTSDELGGKAHPQQHQVGSVDL